MTTVTVHTYLAPEAGTGYRWLQMASGGRSEWEAHFKARQVTPTAPARNPDCHL